MTKGQLKEILGKLEEYGVADSAVVQVRMNIDNGLIDLNQNAFDVKRKQASYAIDASDHWAEQVIEGDLVVLKQA